MPATTENGQEKRLFHYAGIGAKETPEYYLPIMREVATYLEKQDWVLRSGAAPGADTAFEEGIQETKNKEIYLPWFGFNNSGSSLNPKNYPFTQKEQDFTAHFHPRWDRCTPSTRLKHCRNTRILMGCEPIHGPIVRASLFVVCWTIHGNVAGGTGQGLRIAKAHGIPVFNLGLADSKEEIEKMLLDLDAHQAEVKKEIMA